ncbi:MAG TPA: ribonuclease III [Dehalococcoidia bacterium]|nr:ribonuclease III [Dehalococcoidia bacterium]
MSRQLRAAQTRADPAEAPTAAEQRLALRFRRPELLQRAFVHRSLLNETGQPATDSNERLEFLGDAVLGFVVARDLYRRFPEASEGQLTSLRAQLVNGETLATVAKRLELSELLRLGRGEEQTGGRGRPQNLARAFEAVIGALVEDGGLTAAEAFIRRTLAPEFVALASGEPAGDPKSALQVRCQARWSQTPVYRVAGIEGPDHARRFRVEVSLGERVLGSGAGSSKRSAERAAAEMALAALSGSA